MRANAASGTPAYDKQFVYSYKLELACLKSKNLLTLK